MQETLKLVKEFHDAFEISTPNNPTIDNNSPLLAKKLGEISVVMDSVAELAHLRAEQFLKNTPFLRLQLLQEELAELAEALAENNPLNALDALVDLQYVLAGTILTLGLQEHFFEAFEEVHRSNMSKLEDGKPVKNEAGRVMKGKNYSPPKLYKFLQDFNYDDTN